MKTHEIPIQATYSAYKQTMWNGIRIEVFAIKHILYNNYQQRSISSGLYFPAGHGRRNDIIWS